MAKQKPLSIEDVIDTALAAADARGWDALSMKDLAAELDVSPAALHAIAADKNAIADAWFAQALLVMLAPLPNAVVDGPARDRLQILMERWFGALSDHRDVTAQMLGDKMWPFHPHHWVPMIFDLSRLVQWWRDAAGMSAMGRRRQIEEIVLTGIFLATLRYWCRDDSPGIEATRIYLTRKLRNPLFS